ncbi:hypothetical protein G9A89_006175 [Geosiphon pyriformis]|nr:hypothetical protein G9A89_006175 [Geosiphon pyriformis]
MEDEFWKTNEKIQNLRRFYNDNLTVESSDFKQKIIDHILVIVKQAYLDSLRTNHDLEDKILGLCGKALVALSKWDKTVGNHPTEPEILFGPL